jgi:hypothetical protein
MATKNTCLEKSGASVDRFAAEFGGNESIV